MVSAPDPELLAVYESEAVEVVEAVHAHLLRIEQGAEDRAARLEDVLRLAHDIKGSARLVGYELVGRLAHALEACLLGWRGRPDVPRASADLAFRASDHIRALSLDAHNAALQAQAEGLVAELQASVGAPAPAAPPRPAAAPAARAQDAPPLAEAPGVPAATLRVARTHVDAVSDEAAVTLMDALGVAARMRNLGHALEALSALHPPRDGAALRETRRHRSEWSAGLHRARAAHQELADALRRLDGHAHELDERARALCLEPAAPLVTHLERAARDTAAALGRSVRVETEGRELLVDRMLAEALKGPLTHAVRNAVDHGLETPAERLAAGKPPAGLLRLVLREESDHLRVELSDDGRGVDLAAARHKLGARAEGLDDARLLAALLRAGVSTRDQATDISGRGLGLGSLAQVADRLRGEARLSSRAGQGATLTLLLPRQLSLIDVLLVRSGGVAFALPLLGLEGLGAAVAGTKPLARALGLPCPDTAAEDCVLNLSHPEGAVQVAVDDAGQMQRSVRRPLPAHLGSVPCVQGATILPGGEPVLLLDLREVAEACRGAPRRPAARRRILLADDSPTLRARLRSELSGAGFEVVDVADGHEALERLAGAGFDAVVSDVQMPRRDGFAVAERCAGRLPCLLITAQPTPDGEARARGCGAAYLAKDEGLGARVLSFLDPLLHASQGSRP